MGLRENELLICILFLLLLEKQKLGKNSHNEEVFASHLFHPVESKKVNRNDSV